jgi:predicted lipoprotein with Yx(FWY)xxD motif
VTAMRRSVLFCVTVAGSAAAALVAGCGSGSSGYGSQPAASTSASSPVAAAPATVAVASNSLGTILVDAQGKTLYLFEADKNGSSACTGGCANFWPPLVGKPTAGTGITATNLGTITRSDGTTQVTYFGHPLYYFARDVAAGDTKGEGVNAYGADWYVVGTNGSKIDKS